MESEDMILGTTTEEEDMIVGALTEDEDVILGTPTVENEEVVDLAQPSTSRAAQNQPTGPEPQQYIQNVSLFGEPCTFENDTLPTTGDVLRYVFFLYNEEVNRSNKSVPLKSFVTLVSRKIMSVWEKTQIPIISFSSIRVKVLRAIEDYQDSNKKSVTTSFSVYIAKLGSLFDIACCRCDIINSQCVCKNERKIPSTEKEFIIDQRTERNFKIIQPTKAVQIGSDTAAVPGVVDLSENEPRTSDFVESETDNPLPIPFSSDYIPTSDADAVSVAGPSSPCHYYASKGNIEEYVTECDRYGISDRSASALATYLFKGYNVRNNKGEQIIIDRNKIRREREKTRRKIIQKRNDVSLLKAFSFDSRKDKTLAPVTLEGRQHPRHIKETHFCILRQPNSVYLGHVASEHSTSPRKALSLINFFNEKGIGLSQVFGICCDGEPTNTGRLTGILRTFEKQLKRPLHRFVCLLHFNELPLRHIFAQIDGPTTGPTTSAGEIAKNLKDCETKPVI